MCSDRLLLIVIIIDVIVIKGPPFSCLSWLNVTPGQYNLQRCIIIIVIVTILNNFKEYTVVYF